MPGNLSFAELKKAVSAGTIDTVPWITHRAPFDAMIGEFPNWLKPESGVIKAIVSLT